VKIIKELKSIKNIKNIVQKIIEKQKNKDFLSTMATAKFHSPVERVRG